jgi:hypothetical protein
MLIGQTARKILGKDGFRKVGGFYRRIFFDLENFARTMPAIEPGSVILDIGSGDGEPMNYILRRYPDTKVVMTDVGSNIGTFLNEELRSKVELHPRTNIKDLIKANTVKPDYILIMDVLHHVPVDARIEFLNDLKELIGSRPCKIIVKDNQPGHLRTTLGYLSDVYVSGDKSTNLVSKNYLLELMISVFGDVEYYETDLFKIDRPNYSFVFSIQGS